MFLFLFCLLLVEMFFIIALVCTIFAAPMRLPLLVVAIAMCSAIVVGVCIVVLYLCIAVVVVVAAVFVAMAVFVAIAAFAAMVAIFAAIERAVAVFDVFPV